MPRRSVQRPQRFARSKRRIDANWCLGDEPVEIVVRKARGAAAEIAVVVRVDDRAVRHNVRFSRQRIEKRCAAVKARRRYAALLQRVASRARHESRGPSFVGIIRDEAMSSGIARST